MKNIINSYIKIGINSDKIFYAGDCSVCWWDFTNNELMNPINKGKVKETIISCLFYDSLSEQDVIDANIYGIVVSSLTYNKDYYRCAFLSKYKDKIKHSNVGYHLTDIPKGKIGTISKIEEELNELKDAEKQSSKIMKMVELSDLYGAIEEYAITQGLTMDDLKKFSNITKRAFKNGRR